ncbi:unnamed protein product [Adineta ricciae]|uniref:Uncharacterized protein n=1 Tax=Adineta ricciae TaxID=249248 RepID=A0A814LV18_ADIRI|nr:unnamed protein product [Adineta ricciae]
MVIYQKKTTLVSDYNVFNKPTTIRNLLYKCTFPETQYLLKNVHSLTSMAFILHLFKQGSSFIHLNIYFHFK